MENTLLPDNADVVVIGGGVIGASIAYHQKLKIIRVFAGLRPYTPDGLPILGRVPVLDGFVMAAGHEGDGIALAPITGEIIADLIVYNKTRFALKEYNLARF